ncbi:hypothetical protein KAFR_0D03230 [Kazachstania africana CBS 2517]|uniref:Maintenance of telomere capping protein 2 n=1 Tax=Kazachstania africana (strain ATCC 22294 / BCRC 22015 / CBS 2517 / CECT 1963 / NBRC 1671 / NRRL Y-8276) TaxID=1071382 RepID=H2AUC1_KAZAF|nr:hypothetical protein KAFR_0D03230 [Kazachstania africana CBS 2517]CCF57971.1 hypothetical protein KAFR_0D03230 [Kazachstania africana CBS 2517]
MHSLDDASNALMDFETCLRYSVETKKSFICLVRRVRDLNEEGLVQGIQKSIERLYKNDFVACSVLKDIVTSKPIFGDQEITFNIIPNLNLLSNEEQLDLTRRMRRNEMPFEKQLKFQLYMGIVFWDHTSAEDSDIQSNIENDLVRSIFQVENTLRQKFWLCCSLSQFTNEGYSDGSSGYASEWESLYDEPVISEKTQEKSSAKLEDVYVQSSIRRYILDIMVHIRMHRLAYNAKGGGAHTRSLADVLLLSKLISRDCKRAFVTPKEVKAAAVWYFPMHICLISRASMDTSILYGSRKELVQQFLEKIVQVKNIKQRELNNPLFLEYLVVKDVLTKIVPPI